MGERGLTFKDGSNTTYRVIGMDQRFLVVKERGPRNPQWISAETLRALTRLGPPSPTPEESE